MRRVLVAGVETSALGYGTAAFGSSLSQREKQRLLAAALDAGITHFDTARVYGGGAAEEALGRFAARRRDELTIGTKLGLGPPRRALARAAAAVVLRRVRRLSSRVDAAARSRARAGAAALFAPTQARGSLEASLRALGTDHVDFLLLHECRADDIGDELLAFLDECVRAGKARAVGTATGADETAAILARGNGFPQVVQIPFAELDRLPPAHGRGVVTHSALAGAPTAAVPALLEGALAANAGGIVLFSSRRAGRIEAAAALA